MLLIKEVERKSKGTHYPETEAFACNATTFKTNMTGFLLKAEERKSELETSVDLYRFCEEVRQQTRTINCPNQVNVKHLLRSLQAFKNMKNLKMNGICSLKCAEQ